MVREVHRVSDMVFVDWLGATPPAAAAATETPSAPRTAERARPATMSPCATRRDPRVPVLACRDALAPGWRRGGDDRGLLRRGHRRGPQAVRPGDGLTWRGPAVVATASDAQLRAVLRRMVRRYAPPPAAAPPTSPGNRTVPDLPPLGILPLTPGGATDLVAQLGLPLDPAAVAAAVLAGRTRRLDLLRNDGGSVTLDGALSAPRTSPAGPCTGAAGSRSTTPSSPTATSRCWPARSATPAGTPSLDGLPLLTDADPADGRSTWPWRCRWSPVAAGDASDALRGPPGERPGRRGDSPRLGRAVLDDGVEATLNRKRTWWIEPQAWAVFTG